MPIHLELYALFKHSGMRKQECVAILSLLEEEELNSVLLQIIELMDSNGWQFPTQQEIMEILWPILKGKKGWGQ